MTRSRAVFALGFLGCVSAFMVALFYFQKTLGLAPCPLCVVQRLIFISLGMVFLVATLHNPQGRMRTAYAVLTALVSLVGAGVSGWHVRMQNLPTDQQPECGPGLDFMLEVMPVQDVMREIFTGSGECSEVLWSLFGLSIPALTLIAFLGFASYSLWILRSHR